MYDIADEASVIAGEKAYACIKLATMTADVK